MTVQNGYEVRGICSITGRDKDEATVTLLLANLTPAQVQQFHSHTATSAITKLERYFIKNGWMPKEA